MGTTAGLHPPPAVFTQTQSLRGARAWEHVPRALSILPMPALLGDSGTLWFQLLSSSAHYLWVCPAQGTARMRTPPFRAEARQVPRVQEVRFRGLLGREKETGGQEADAAEQLVLQTQSRAWRATRDHTEEGRTDGRDCTVAAARAGWGSNLDSMVKPGRMEEQEWGERVFSL